MDEDQHSEIGTLPERFARSLLALKNALNPSRINYRSSSSTTTDQLSELIRDGQELDELLELAKNEQIERSDQFDEFITTVLPKCFNKLLCEDCARYWSQDSSQHIQRRNQQLVSLLAHLLSRQLYDLVPLSCFVLFDPDCLFYVKNKHGPPPSYTSITTSDNDDDNSSNKEENKFTQSNTLFPYVDEVLERFGQSNGFDQLQAFIKHFSHINQIAKFLQMFANSISFLSVSLLN